MPRIQCQCGTDYDLTSDYYGHSSPCANCNRLLRFIVSQAPAGSDLAPADSALALGLAVDFAASLVIRAGPDRVGEQIFLAGDALVAIGKLPEHPISLSAPLVSRHHCTLFPSDGGHWRIEDHSSRNGLFVNGERTQSHELRHGDRLGIGDYTLVYHSSGELPPPEPAPLAEAPIDLSSESDFAPKAPAPPPPPPPQPAAPTDDEPLQAIPIPPPTLEQAHQTLLLQPTSASATLTCPSCHRPLGPRDKICIPCGIDVHTGRTLRISHEVGDNFHAHAALITQPISWFIWLNLMPIASDAYGRFKPRAMYAITLITIVITVAVWIIDAASGHGEFGPCKNLMLWAGDQPSPIVMRAARISHGTPGELHYYQFLTHAFLHGGVLHIAGNLVFLLTFGNRVNAVLGQWKTAVSYLILAVCSGIAFYISEIGKPIIPELGASGAIMGMAGMYFVLMPTSRIYMIFWAGLGPLSGFMRYMKIFRIRGVWMLLLWVGLNDVFPVLRGSTGHVAHWSHIGGFSSGAILAMLLLLTRQVNANGGDLLSVTLGRRAWKILGSPADRAAAWAGA